MYAQAFKVGMRAPDDVSEAARLLDARAFSAEHVVAILGKTEGNGGVNDYTRALATLSFQILLAERSGQKVSAIAKRVPIIWSGVTEGLMSPHATIFTREPDRGTPSGQKRLGIGVASAAIEAGKLSDDVILHDFSIFSEVASTSSGVELMNCEVIVLGNSARSTSGLHMAHALMKDAIDGAAVREALRRAGLAVECELGAADRERLINVFVKCEPDLSGATRGRRHVMFEDSDVNATRHIRGAVNAVVASVTGDTMCYVSAGAEHQGPPGGGVVAVLARAPGSK